MDIKDIPAMEREWRELATANNRHELFCDCDAHRRETELAKLLTAHYEAEFKARKVRLAV